MKSLHVPFAFYPDAVGGTEVYVAALASALARQSHPAVVAAPFETTIDYVHDGIPVRRFAISGRVADPSALYGEGDPNAAEAFAQVLDRERPDVVHLHAFTRACSVLLVRAARRRGIPVVFTYHTPTVSCARGTMMRWGATPCDGVLDVTRCAACALEGRGMPKPLAQLIGRLPPTDLARSAKVNGRVWTALRFSSLIANQQAATRMLFGEVDRIVALRDWIRDLLVANGVAPNKIVQSRHAVCHSYQQRARPTGTANPLRVVFMGRLDPTKGLDVLIRAVRLIPELDATLDVYGAMQGSSGQRELARLKQLAGDDARVTFRPAVDSNEVIDTLAQYDMLAVPSQWMETGPLVVLEAFAAGIPVIGSALGGIAELVSDGVNGLLVEDYRSATAWADALRRLGDGGTLVTTLRRHVTAPAGMDDVASDMLRLYQSVARTSSQSTSTASSVA